MVSHVLLKFRCDPKKTVGEFFFKFPAPYGPVLTKIFKSHKILSLGQIAKKVKVYQFIVLCIVHHPLHIAV